MFTGIITDIGCVKKITQGGDVRFDITTTYETAGINIGASIACSGVCLTVIEKGADWFAVEASQETLSLSTAGAWQANTPLNLERALTMGDELGGHIVSGHVDGVAKIEAIDSVGDSKRFTFCAPPDLMRFVAIKGSIVLDGVSLTVNSLNVNSPTENTFSVNIIPHTQGATTFGAAQMGDKVNIEIDMLARYVARLQDWKGDSDV